jgi:hypothetical protein
MSDLELTTELKNAKVRTCQQCGADISALHHRRKFCETCKPSKITVPERSTDKPKIRPSTDDKKPLSPSDVKTLVATANTMIPAIFTQITPGSSGFVYVLNPDGTVATDDKGIPRLTQVGQALLIDPAEELALTWVLPKVLTVDLPPSVRKAIAPLGAVLGVGMLGLLGWLHTQRVLAIRREILRAQTVAAQRTTEAEPNPDTNAHIAHEIVA